MDGDDGADEAPATDPKPPEKSPPNPDPPNGDWPNGDWPNGDWPNGDWPNGDWVGLLFGNAAAGPEEAEAAAEADGEAGGETTPAALDPAGPTRPSHRGR